MKIQNGFHNAFKKMERKKKKMTFVNASFFCLFRFSSSCVNVPVFRSALFVAFFDDFGPPPGLELFAYTIDLRFYYTGPRFSALSTDFCAYFGHRSTDCTDNGATHYIY